MRNLGIGLLALDDDAAVNDDQRLGSSTSLQVLDALAAAPLGPLLETLSEPVLADEPASPGTPTLDLPPPEDPAVTPFDPPSDPAPVETAPPAADETPTPAAPTPVFTAGLNDPQTISASQILLDRPDVFRAFYTEFYDHNDRHSTAWIKKVGGETPETYATYWYEHYGKYEGYSQGATTAGDNVSLEKILTDRPDVLRAFYTEFYGPNNDRHSSAWVDRVGGDTPEAYAKYWYEKHGKWEGYSQTEKAAAENIDVERLLVDRPDVFRAFYTEFYGPNNDRHSSAWVDRVGGDTVQDYAKYWYKVYGKAAGYNQSPQPQAIANPSEQDDGVTPDQGDSMATDAATEAPVVVDPSLDPWNHPAIYPDYQMTAEGLAGSAHAAAEMEILDVGKALNGVDIFG